MKFSRRAVLSVAAAAGAAATASACGLTADDGSGSGGPLTGLRIMVPNSPGGGYDTTARSIARVMEDEGIAKAIEVFNLEGAGGTVGLQRTVSESGNGDLAMQMGLGVVGASYTQASEARLTDTTAIAKLVEESGAIVVPTASPFETIDDLVAAWAEDLDGVTVGGGSSPGGPDHLLPMQLAGAVGIDPTKVNYVSYDGGGELLPALLGDKVSFGASGVGEFIDQINAGQLRVLAVSGAERVDLVPDAPTLVESGIELEFTNWRGWVAPPGIEDADRQKWIDALTDMHESDAWQEELEKQGWTDAFITGDDFGDFLTEQDQMVADVLAELGLA
ncbi:Bug family tripartite tricarboxylate transporter substrate binding protein [Glycomyces buryatensis]|uniref:Tripartite tricarboxylate transporter substrate binding protein n=1 Tax=Glycomyces buryatensis TaxID=2570927 RepID=A0A4S8Q8E6_9ACTN|nr:tripartite tricarboxylate transporter substrate binding protein [Glycomyces buryatensis]THV40548.1 tripartite tricarboxylate transporter substrate binding protein [Glycomyces buryatensis]